MEFKKKVTNLLDEALENASHLFLLKFEINSNHQIQIEIDGDKAVSVKDCVSISRAIEHNLDREEIDFSLQVSSAGASAPLVHPRQYKKHIGRKLAVDFTDGTTIKGKLTQCSENTISLFWKNREPKEIGKGKRTVEYNKVFDFNQIKQAKVVLQF